jgi:hypothetical protein
MAICGAGSHNAIKDKKGKFERAIPDIKQINVRHYLEENTKGTSFYGGRWLKNKKTGQYDVVNQKELKKMQKGKSFPYTEHKQAHDGQFCTMPKDVKERAVYATTEDRKKYNFETINKTEKPKEYEKGRFSNPEGLTSIMRKNKTYNFPRKKKKRN